jgi:hypothetical protein
MISTLSEIYAHLKPIVPIIICATALELLMLLISIPITGVDNIDRKKPNGS